MTELETASAARIAELEMVIESLSARVQEVGAIGRREHVKVLELEAELAAMRAGGEPFCWHWRHIETDKRGVYYQHPSKFGLDMSRLEYEWEILYTHPQPAAQDAERLDWMIENRAYVVSDETCCDGFWLHYARPNGTTWVQVDEHATPRAAIDAAIAAQQGDSNE